MPKLISVYVGCEIIECPDEWEAHKGHIGECSVYESEKRSPGKRWFYFIYDNGDRIGYFHCGMADMEKDEENSTLTFISHGGEHKYVIKIGDKMPEDYLPYQVVGHGEDAVLIGPSGIPLAWEK